ncbi:hypothetical protein FY034_13230 [Trichlorobacter lovleyi]|uniref:hypothetical protein n=1 Tax=Trichlorobacter lovleyi TaxID=313985 RepID=UPI00223FAB8C|nr:hypothetical protein [Trichlorobacter lovleyi]QOX79853.1 hypothetical protein FY034_13230 [Trichlorobacter lovleyi]
MKHTTSIQHYSGSPQQLAEDMGDLYYNALAELLELLAGKLELDAAKDSGRGRIKLATELNHAAVDLQAATGHIQQAWRICEPFMMTEALHDASDSTQPAKQVHPK